MRALGDRLAAQNHLVGYRDCVLEGGQHKLDRSRATRVGSDLGGWNLYVPCRRCPASILNPRREA